MRVITGCEGFVLAVYRYFTLKTHSHTCKVRVTIACLVYAVVVWCVRSPARRRAPTSRALTVVLVVCQPVSCIIYKPHRNRMAMAPGQRQRLKTTSWGPASRVCVRLRAQGEPGGH